MIDENIGERVIHDLSTLPNYVLTSILYILRQEIESEIEKKVLDFEEGDLRLLLKSIPRVCVKYGGRTEKEKYDSGESVRCRHAVRLCQRSPYCPIVSATKQANPDLERMYKQMTPLFEAAGFGQDDLSLGQEDELEFKPGKDIPSRPYRR